MTDEPHGGAYAAAVRAEVLALAEDVRQAHLQVAAWEHAVRAQAEGAALREERLRCELERVKQELRALRVAPGEAERDRLQALMWEDRQP